MKRIRWIAAVVGMALAVTATACSGSSGIVDGPTRDIAHAMGVTAVKTKPERVVVLDSGELDTVAALGVHPVGMVRPDVSTEGIGYLQDKVSDAEIVGTIQDPNLERIAALSPDLILGSKLRVGDKYDQLSALAPTVLSETVGRTWKENFLLFGDALGKKDEAAQALGDYESRARRLGAELGDPAATSVSAVRFMPQGKGMRLYNAGSFIGVVLADVGLGRPAGQRDPAKTFVEAGPEEVSRAGGDAIFYASYGPKSGTKQDQVTEGPIWKRLDGVQKQKAFEVSDELWYLGTGLGAANEILEQLKHHLAE